VNISKTDYTYSSNSAATTCFVYGNLLCDSENAFLSTIFSPYCFHDYLKNLQVDSLNVPMAFRRFPGQVVSKYQQQYEDSPNSSLRFSMQPEDFPLDPLNVPISPRGDYQRQASQCSNMLPNNYQSCSSGSHGRSSSSIFAQRKQSFSSPSPATLPAWSRTRLFRSRSERYNGSIETSYGKSSL
jgi:hypothetical protein